MGTHALTKGLLKSTVDELAGNFVQNITNILKPDIAITVGSMVINILVSAVEFMARLTKWATGVRA